MSTPYPKMPFSAQVSSVLIQDAINTNTVVVGLDQDLPQSAAPWVGTFCNPFKNGLAEAFVITDTASDGTSNNGTYALNYLAQDPTAVHGWTLTPIPGIPDGCTPVSVVSCMAVGFPNFFCTLRNAFGASRTLWHGWLDGDGNIVTETFEFMYPVPTLKVAYYNPVIQGRSNGPLPTTGEGPFPIVYSVSDVNYVGPGLALCSTLSFDGAAWHQDSEMMGQPGSPYTASDWTLFPIAQQFGDWVLVCANKSLPAGESLTSVWRIGETVVTQSPYSRARPPVSPPPVTAAESFADVCWEGMEYGFRPLYVDTNGVPFLYDAEYGSIVLPVNTSGTITSARAVTDHTGTTSVFLIDSDENLFFLTQTGLFSSSAAPEKYTIQWAPSVAISGSLTESGGVNEGCAALYPSLFPYDPPTLFTANAAGELRLRQLNAATDAGPGGWMNHTPALAQVNTYELATYRTQFTLTDVNGVPVSNRKIDVSSSTVTAAVLNGTVQMIGPGDGQSTTVTTTAGGTATVALVASDFAPATLTFTDAPGQSGDDRDDEPAFGVLSVAPAAPVQAYLAGSAEGISNGGLGTTGSLTYMGGGNTTFTSDTISGAQNPNPRRPGSLFPGVQGDDPVMTADNAHTAIQSLMAKGTGQSNQGPGSAQDADGGLAGFIINRDVVTGRPSYQEFHDRDAYLRELALHNTFIGESLWGDIESIADSIWQGIKSAAMTVYHVGVNLVDGIVQIAVRIGDAIVSIGSIVIKGIEDAVNVVMAVFSAIEAYVKDVIDFLKALFDGKAVFACQEALAAGLTATIDSVAAALANARSNLGPQSSFFADLQGAIRDGFGSAATGIGSGTTLGGNSTYQQYAEPSSVTGNTSTITKTGAGGTAVSPADLAASPHAHYLTHRTFGAVTPPTGSGGDGRAPGRPAPAQRTVSEFIEDLGRQATGSGRGSATDDPDPFWDFCRELFGSEAAKDLFRAFGEAVQQVIAWIKTQIDPSDPGEWQNLGIGDLLSTIAEELIEAFLALLDEVVVDLLGLIVDCVEDVKTFLGTNLSGPLVVPLLLGWNFFALLAGDPLVESITILEGLTLLAAVPVHVIGTIIEGKSASLSWPPESDAQRRRGDGVPGSTGPWASIYYVGGALAGVVEGLALMYLDLCAAAGESWSDSWADYGGVVTAIGVGCNLLSVALTIPFPMDTLNAWPIADWAVGALFASLSTVGWQLFKMYYLNDYLNGATPSDSESLKTFALSAFNMVLGLVDLVVNIVADCEEGGEWDADRILAAISSGLGPLANIFSPLGTGPVQEVCPEWVAWIPPAADVTSYVVGGLIGLFANLEV
ncbi:hypothetical protein ABZ456_27320 [Streptomyces sp. NPDC005776]|uniref:hypothetical protein n=1 Tax=Streptomyces sp. NPDC005776 TaxID=3154676 RepID=UPI0033CAACD1